MDTSVQESLNQIVLQQAAAALALSRSLDHKPSDPINVGTSQKAEELTQD